MKLTSLGNVNENESCVVINQNKSQARQVDTTARTDMFDLDQCYYINTPLTRILKCSNTWEYERERKGLGLGFIFLRLDRSLLAIYTICNIYKNLRVNEWTQVVVHFYCGCGWAFFLVFFIIINYLLFISFNSVSHNYFIYQKIQTSQLKTSFSISTKW